MNYQKEIRNNERKHRNNQQLPRNKQLKSESTKFCRFLRIREEIHTAQSVKYFQKSNTSRQMAQSVTRENLNIHFKSLIQVVTWHRV